MTSALCLGRKTFLACLAFEGSHFQVRYIRVVLQCLLAQESLITQQTSKGFVFIVLFFGVLFEGLKTFEHLLTDATAVKELLNMDSVDMKLKKLVVTKMFFTKLARKSI